MTFTPKPLTATWKRIVSNDGFKNVWAEVSIACTFRQRRRKTVDKRGNGVMSTAVICCDEDVQPDDVIIFRGKAWPVISIDDSTDVNNEIVERIVNL